MKTSAVPVPWLRQVLDQNERLVVPNNWPITRLNTDLVLLARFFDLALVTVVAGDISAMTDESLIGSTIDQSSAGARPTLVTTAGVVCGEYDGGRALAIGSTFAAMLTGDFTAWVVVRSADNSGSTSALRLGDVATGAGLDIEANRVCIRHVGGAVMNDGTPTLTWQLWCWTRTAGVDAFFVNGTDTSISSAALVVPVGVSTWGALTSAFTFGWLGWLAEIGGLNTALDAAGQASLATYAADRYPLGT